jgi:hypothetical protein
MGSETLTAPEPSDAEAMAALQALLGRAEEPEAGGGLAEDAETAPADVPAEAAKAEAVIGQVDDIESLKARMKSGEESFESFRNKTSQSLEWSRNLALKTATERDNLKSALRKIKEKGEVSAEEIDRLLGSQQAPVPTTSGGPAYQDDGFVAAEAFRFSNDYRLDDAAQGRFDVWIQAQSASNSIRGSEIIEGNPYMTFQNLYSRFSREAPVAQVEPGPDMVKAAQNVARTQRAAARAAGPPSTRSPASSPPDSGIDLEELIRKDPDKAASSGLIDKLFKEVNTAGY